MRKQCIHFILLIIWDYSHYWIFLFKALNNFHTRSISSQEVRRINQVEKCFAKSIRQIQHPFIVNSSQQTRNGGNFLKPDKEHLEKNPSANMVHDSGRMNAFLQSGQEKFTHATAISHYTEGLSQGINFF